MSDCTFMETAFPLYPGTYWSRPVNGADRLSGLLATDWRMGLSVLWVAPVSFFLAAGTRPMVDRIERRKGKNRRLRPGIQGVVRIYRISGPITGGEAYLEDWMKNWRMENITIRLELLNGILVTAGRRCS